MASPYHLNRGFFTYDSDDSNSYQIGTSIDNGNAQSATAVPAGTSPTYPRGWVPRHIYGVDASGNRTKVPIMDPTNGLWTGSTNTFTKNSVSFTVEGRIGEKRTTKGG